MHLETVQKMLQSLKATPTYGMVRIPTLSYENVAGALDIGADALLIPQIRTMDDIRRLKDYSQYPPIGHRGSGSPACGTMATASPSWPRPGHQPHHQHRGAAGNRPGRGAHRRDRPERLHRHVLHRPRRPVHGHGYFRPVQQPPPDGYHHAAAGKDRQAGKRLGIFAGNFDAARNWYAKGFDMCIINSELALLSSAVAGEVGKLRSELEAGK